MPVITAASPTSTQMTPAAAPPSRAATAALTTVLVVDDSPVDRRLAASIVGRRPDLRAIMAGGGPEALDWIGQAKPAAVVTDLHMPGMNGLELVQVIRREHPGLPVILMTAYGSEEIAIQALRHGAANYVRKKALASELIETLDGVLALAAGDRPRRRLMTFAESRRTEFKIGTDTELIGPLISILQEDIDGLEICDGNARTRVGVALQEALANALYHGNLEVSSELRQVDEHLFYAEAANRCRSEPYCSRSIHVESDIDRHRARFVICDEGPGFDVSAMIDPFDPENLMRIGGRGMLLIRSFMDEVEHNAQGNEITMIKRRCATS